MRMIEIKFIANVNVEKPLIDFLIEKGYDVKWVADLDKQMSDISICEMAAKEQRVILTNDKDFGEIVFLQRKAIHGIVLLRVRGQIVTEKIGLLKRLLDRHAEKIMNHFVVVMREKFRFIPMEVIRNE